MRWAVAVVGITLVCLAMLLPPELVAFPGLLTQFTDRYPAAAGSKLDSCVLCHASASGGSLNPYGAAVGAGGNFAGVENQDSDGDGFSNIEEIEALTFPGNASDFPEDPGPGPGPGPDPCDPYDPDNPDCPVPPEPEGRIHDRATIVAVRDAYSAGVGAADDRDVALAVLSGDLPVAARGADDGVFAVAINREGEIDDEALELDDLAGARVHGVEYDGLRNMLLLWSGDGTGIQGQAFNVKNGRARGSASTIASGSQASIVWDPEVQRFLVASSSGSGVSMVRRTRRGNGDGAAAQSIGQQDVIGFAGTTSEGAVLVASGGGRPVGVLIENGLVGPVSLAYRASSSAAQNTAAALGGGDLGLVAMNVGGTVSIGIMGADGSLLGVAEPQTLANVGRMAAAPQADGSFLLFWIDTQTRMLMAADYGANGKIIGEPFEVQDLDEAVDPDVLAVEPFGGEVLVIYATTGRGSAFRSVFVNLRD